MASERRKPKTDEGGGAYWMDTYGDMVTLLMTFFVLLYSFSTIDAKKWEELVQSATGRPQLVVIEPLTETALQPGVEGVPPNLEEQATELEQRFDELFQLISSHITDNNLGSQLTVEQAENLITIRVQDRALFDSGQTSIRPEAAEILPNIVAIFEAYEPYIAQIQIIGHTDTDPISGTYQDNWHLSVNRSYSILRYISRTLGSSFPQRKFYIGGQGETNPVDTNQTETGKQNNRRVEFVILGDYDPADLTGTE